MASVMLAAQTVAPAQKAGSAAKPAATQAKPAAAPAKPAAAPVKAATASAKPAATAAKPVAKPAAAKAPAGKSVKVPAAKAAVAKSKAGAKTTARAVRSAAKRDPFVSPVRATSGVACPSGKKCLVIDTIVLKGIARTQQGNIALVESAARKASYFLRENDPVFNGFVVKITGDSVVFRENVVDAVGRKSMREVVKKVVAPVV
jgi:Tfp pilus assembly protein PilP